MLVIDSFVYFMQGVGYIVFFDTFKEGDGESPSVQSPLDQDIGAGSSPDYAGLILIGRKFPFCEVVIYQGHPTVTVTNEAYI